jgi:transcriptional regulator with XRE-family HTH domain
MNTFPQHISSYFHTQNLLPFATENNMNEEPMALADRIRTILAELEGPEYGKQARLAKIAGCGRPAVNNWLTGQQRIAGEHALAISNALGYRIEWLVEGKGPKKKGERDIDAAVGEKLFMMHVTQTEMEMITAYRTATTMGRALMETAWKAVPKEDYKGD